MLFRVAGGLWFIFYASSALGLYTFPPIVMGILAILAGVGLLAGV